MVEVFFNRKSENGLELEEIYIGLAKNKRQAKEIAMQDSENRGRLLTEYSFTKKKRLFRGTLYDRFLK